MDKQSSEFLNNNDIPCVMDNQIEAYKLNLEKSQYSERDIIFMRMALKEAEKAQKKGEVPIGAVLVLNDKVIARTHNLRQTTKDATAHAEILAIKKASKKLKTWHLVDCELYVTLEPCPMCSGAIINSRINRVIFGAYDSKAGCCGTLYNLPQDARFNHRPKEIIGGVLENECADILSKFFKSLRNK